MKKSLKWGIYFGISALYVVGNNQIVGAETVGSMESQASIQFDQSYFPPEIDPVIPSGHTAMPVYTGKRILPKTGEAAGVNWRGLGGILLTSAYVLKRRSHPSKTRP